MKLKKKLLKFVIERNGKMVDRSNWNSIKAKMNLLKVCLLYRWKELGEEKGNIAIAMVENIVCFFFVISMRSI